MTLHWKQTGRANHQAANGRGHYTVDRWAEQWSIHYVPGSWPEDQATPPRRVAWQPGKHTLATAKASCQHDHDEGSTS